MFKMFVLTAHPLHFVFCAQYSVNFFIICGTTTVLRGSDLRYQHDVSPVLASALVNVGHFLIFMFMLSLTHSAVVPKEIKYYYIFDESKINIRPASICRVSLFV